MTHGQTVRVERSALSDRCIDCSQVPGSIDAVLPMPEANTTRTGPVTTKASTCRKETHARRKRVPAENISTKGADASVECHHFNKLQLLYLSVQQSQCSIIVMQSEANQC